MASDGFRDWVDRLDDPNWPLMPLTHITKGVNAGEIAKSGEVVPINCEIFGKPLAYFFYGRPAYRVAGDGAIKAEAACPFCFIFKAELVKEAASSYAFDTGALAKRMYKHALFEEMDADDFSFRTEFDRMNKLVATVFSSRSQYFDGNALGVDIEGISEPWEFHARSYLHLLTSPGRNEPDDRICSIEIVFEKSIPLSGNLLAAIVPHTVWGDKKAPWLEELNKNGAQIVPYMFVPGRHPEHYHAIMELEIKRVYKDWGAL